MVRLLVVILLCILLLSPSSALAANPEVDITVSAFVVGTPSGLILTYISDYEVGIEWTKGEGAENTMIRGAVGRMPESRTDGFLVYYGDGTNCSDTGVSLDETMAQIIYRVWSQNAAGVWEEEGISDFIEGVGMTVFAIVAIVLALMAMGFIFKNGVLFLAASLGWIIFAFMMYGKAFDNAALNEGLLMFGGAMTIITAVMAYLQWAAHRPGQPEDEQESYRRQILSLTRRKPKYPY